MKLALVLISVFVVNHILACMWWLTFSYQQKVNEDESEKSIQMSQWILIKQYGEALHDTSYMLFGSPPNNTGRSPTELLISSFFGMAGQLYFAYVMAKLVEILSQRGILQARRNENTSIINAAVSSLGLPNYLQKRILYYNQFRNLNADEPVTSFLFESLSHNLVTELKLHLFRWLVHGAPFFQDVPKIVINKIVLNFLSLVFTPGDIIIRSGDVGTNMYFIMQGVVEVFINPGGEVVDEEDCKVISTRVAGDYFGEIALIFRQLRSASIRSSSYSVLSSLSRDNLDFILTDHPRVRKQLVRRITNWDVAKPKPETLESEPEDDYNPHSKHSKDKDDDKSDEEELHSMSPRFSLAPQRKSSIICASPADMAKISIASSTTPPKDSMWSKDDTSTVKTSAPAPNSPTPTAKAPAAAKSWTSAIGGKYKLRRASTAN